MSREIKFRAWDNEDKIMIESFSHFGKVGHCYVCNFNPTHTFEIQQFTGLKDKNGKEIYEGDVLKYQGQVIWNEEESRWSCIDLTWNDKREIHDIDYLTSPYEIIGNIFENPELLKN